MKIYTDPRLLSLGVIGGTVSRQAGNMRQKENQDALFAKLDIPAQRVLRFHQVHADRIISVLDAAAAQAVQSGPLQEADGWILKPRGWGAAVLTADCVPVYIWDEKASFVALVHAGWRGVVQKLPQQAALELRAFGAKGKLCAYLGPHIQKCCFEVQEDVAVQFSKENVIRQGNKIWVDLSQEIIGQLAQAGVNPQDVYAPALCTCGNKENFFSYRRDHQKDALLSFIYKP